MPMLKNAHKKRKKYWKKVTCHTCIVQASSSQHGPCLPSPPLSLLTAAMVLCGVPAVVASRTIACVQVLTDLAVDLAVYTFSFVVFHVIWDDWVG